MMDKKYIFIAIAVVVLLFVGGVGLWEYSRQAEAARIEAEILKGVSSDELGLMIKSQEAAGDPSVSVIAESPEARKAFIEGLKEHLSLAAEARREGLADEPLFKTNLEYKKNLLLAELYPAKLGHDAKNPYPISDAEMEAVWASAENNEAFKRDMDAMQQIQISVNEMLGTGMAPGILHGESLDRAKKKWARAKLISERAKQHAEFMASRDVQLRLKVLEAGILSSDFLRKHWKDRIKASDAEIKAFIASNPEYDVRRKRQLADEVLKRAAGGESFDKLAKEFSEHRPTKNTGGLFEELLEGDIEPQLQAALMNSEPGKVINRVIETDLGWHVAKLEKLTNERTSDGREVRKYTFRQILIQNKFEQPGVADPNIPPPFMTAEEIAKMLVEQEKRNKFVAEYLEKNKIEMPEDFALKAG